MKALIEKVKWNYISKIMIKIMINMVTSFCLSLITVYFIIGTLVVSTQTISFKYIFYLAIPIWIFVFAIKIAITIQHELIQHESIPIGNLWTDVFDDLPIPGLINENTQDYQQYMCLIKISDKMDVRPLKFSENKRWVHGDIDMTAYVIAWEKLPNFPNITEVVKEELKEI